VGLTTLSPSTSRLSRQCGILDISQPYRPSRPVKGIALLFFYRKGCEDGNQSVLESKIFWNFAQNLLFTAQCYHRDKRNYSITILCETCVGCNTMY
jgi:hypothetical protein